MVESHYEILWYENLGSGLGRHPIKKYESGIDNPQKKAITPQQCLRSNMLGLCIKNSLATDYSNKLRAFRYAYTFNTQDDGAEIYFCHWKNGTI